MSRKPSYLSICILVTAFVASPGSVHAGDLNPPAGPVTGTMKTLTEVEPRIAVNATNTPGDADSLYKITQPGSYYLTGNITGVSGKYGIEITASDVTLDLDGHKVLGVPGSLSGISNTATVKNTVIAHGTVSGWQQAGVGAGGDVRVEGVHAANNGSYGIVVGDYCIILNCSASGNVVGIIAGYLSTVENCIVEGSTTGGGIETAAANILNNCTVVGCAGNGIVAGASSVLTACSASFNSGVGFYLYAGSLATRCTAQQNSAGFVSLQYCGFSQCTAILNYGSGIATSGYSTLSNCVANDNNQSGIDAGGGSSVEQCVTSYNQIDGIRADGYCRITGNTAVSNAGAGIHLLSIGAHVEDNMCVLNSVAGLDIDGIKNHVSGNVVNANADNYDIVAGNQLNLLLSQIPESIDWPATVKLAGDLTGVSGLNGITIAADNVTIDLDGHALVGVGGALDGINVSGSRRNIAIRNGTCRNWPGDGIDAANAGNSHFDGLKLSNNTGDGLRAGVDCAIRACSALSNGGDGIEGGGNGTILDCFSNANTLTGILAGDSTIVANCEAAFNSVDGIRVGTASTVRHCIVRGSTGDGIEAGTSCTIADNHTDLNGNGAGSGAGVHITGSGNRVEGNACLSADRGVDVDATGNLIIRNTARSNTTNYDIVAGNRYGPIIDITAGGTAAVSGSSAASTVSSTDPWANFAH